ncbi:MAG: glutamate 5-kinase [Candidatus Dadabacteria bacterium]|nr:glutamate 5-kinase [Candidatus Dadabacteria bacterium]NIS08190.1 glutamate 5-kinase [Candidatus Dadabacteria bacterium]NIY21340.1 glutamate 5-kinase [Candidatus Dadabacteria bacterium]
MSDKERKEYLDKVSRVVIKIGSSVLTRENGELNEEIFDLLAAQVSPIKSSGLEVIIVSSGAIASGMKKLSIDKKPEDIVMKQALAACGQSTLMGIYENSFSKHSQITAQVLLTHAGISDRKRFITARKTIMKLLRMGIIPVINENDVVANEEIMVGDNDNLAALVTSLIEGDLLILLTNIDGLYSGDPEQNKDAKLISLIKEVNGDIEKYAGKTRGKTTTGGMVTKIEAVKNAAAFGVPTIIANGKDPSNISAIFDGKDVGTFFLPAMEKLSERKHWIAFAHKPLGTIFIDDGAARAIKEAGKSLLPSGITSVEGDFDIGELVVCVDSSGNEIARGLTAYGAGDIKKLAGQKTSNIEKILGYKYSDEIIHRDDLVLL